MESDPPFIGDWFKEKRLGAGAFGTVDLWRNKKTSASVAIKRTHSTKDEHIARWQNEIDLMTNKIKHPNIVKVVSQLNGSKFMEQLQNLHPRKIAALAFEFCELGDLRRVLHRPASCNGLPELEVRELLKSLGSAIAYLHDMEIIHRDLKPENIVLKMENERIVYKLTDLGYAKAMDKQDSTTLVGTEEYVAPELLASDKYTYSADYWSFGIIAFEVICGWRPFIPHASLAKRLLTISEKKSHDICIIETNKVEDYHYFGQVFPENQISKSLKPLLEKWLVLALEFNPKQRGKVFERSSTNGHSEPSEAATDLSKSKQKVKFVDEIGKGPPTVVKIFSDLDEALKRKFLTFFCLHTYKFFELEIDATTSMEDLYVGIERQTGVVQKECELVLPMLQKVYVVTAKTKPLELFIPDSVDQPMLFVSKVGQLMEYAKPNVSASVQEVFQNIKIKLRPHCLKRFVSDSYFLVRSEQRKYATLLDGLKNQSVRTNDVILQQKQEMQKLLKLVYGLNGAVEMFVITLSQTKETIEEKSLIKILGSLIQVWEEQCTKLEFNVLKLTEATDKINKRYESVLKRSREVLVNNLLRNPHEEAFDLTSTKNAFEKVRTQLQEKKTHEKSHIEMLQLVYELLKKRDALLKSASLKELQQHLIDVKIEMEEIRKAIEMAIQQAEKYKVELTTLNKELHDQLWKIFDGNRESIYEYLPDLEQMKMAEQPKSVNGLMSFKIGAEVTPTLKDANGQSVLCFGEGCDATSLINDNETLILATDDLIQDGFRQLSEL